MGANGYLMIKSRKSLKGKKGLKSVKGEQRRWIPAGAGMTKQNTPLPLSRGD